MNSLLSKLASKSLKKLTIATALLAVIYAAMLSFALVQRAQETKVQEVPVASALQQAEAQKSAIWIPTTHQLLLSKESRQVARLPEASKTAQLEVLVKKGVALSEVPSLEEVFLTPATRRLQDASRWVLFSALGCGILLLTLKMMKANQEEVKRHEEAQKAKAGGPSEALIDFTRPDTTFKDVAGCDEAVEALEEMASYMKDPRAFKRLGIRMPKGALLAGPPGTGKTLLARALAGEAKVPFFTASGSEFTEVYVGTGAKRVRDLFAKMREHEKAILFLDEIDAVARKRSSGPHNGNQEAESTLNQLLTEIDGFNNKADDKAIMVIAATNRADLIDPALTRGGRLERKIEVPNPDRVGREKILRIHVENKPLEEEVDLALIAARTPGFSGADMATIANEAGLSALRRGASTINHKDFDAAVATVAMGPPRRSAFVTPQDRLITAWHEAGHTVCGFLQEDHDDPVAVSIVPRGPAGGVTWFSGSDDIFMRRKKAKAKLVTAFGGRVAEELLLEGEHTQGPSGDFQQATEIAYAMVTKYGMTEVGFQVRDDSVAVSDEKVKAQVEALLQEAYQEAKALLEEHRGFLMAVVDKLLEESDVTYRQLEVLALEAGLSHVRTMESIPEVPQAEGSSEGRRGA